MRLESSSQTVPVSAENTYDLASFGLREMILAGQFIRDFSTKAVSMQGAADLFVRYFHSLFVSQTSGEKNCVLVRCFKTHSLDQLPESLRSRITPALSRNATPAKLNCLTMLASAGELPEWNDIASSAGHAVIPLESVAAVERAPMIAQLIRQLGIDIQEVLNPSEDLLLQADERAYGVFHVENALGSSSVPAQEDFVVKFGVKSVLGFGGILPSGDLFAVILFSRVRITRPVANLFRTLALSVKLVLLPFTRGPIFKGEPPPAWTALASQEQELLRSETATLRLLIPALEAAALYQTAQLQDVIVGINHQKAEYEKLATRLSSMLESTTDAVFILDRTWRFTYLNQRAYALLLRNEQVLGKNIWEEFPEALEGDYWRNYHIAMEEGRPVQFQEYYPEPLDKRFEIHAFPSEPGIAVFFHDITDRLKTQAVLIKNEKLAAVGRLAASISHEINNPLEAATNLLYLARTTDAAVDIQEYLATADRELRRVAAITSQTLRFYKQSTRPTQISCHELFDEVLSIHQGRIHNSVIAVERRWRSTHPVLCFDGEIRQVLNNLVGNAIDAMHSQGGRLILRSRDGRDWKTERRGLCITVADTGPGMSPQTLKKAMEPFFTTKGIGGTGLGLWISREIIERHKGSLALKSSQKPTSLGTVTTLFLPYDAVVR